jgi:hypothetical protein
MIFARRSALLLTLLLASGCSGDARDLPDPEEFAAGTCRDAAPAVIALDEQVRRAADEGADIAQVRAALESEQQRLLTVLDDAGDTGAVAGELQEVVTRVGFARAAVNIDSFGDAEVRDVTAAVDGFVAACVPSSG